MLSASRIILCDNKAHGDADIQNGYQQMNQSIGIIVVFNYYPVLPWVTVNA